MCARSGHLPDVTAPSRPDDALANWHEGWCNTGTLREVRSAWLGLVCSFVVSSVASAEQALPESAPEQAAPGAAAPAADAPPAASGGEPEEPAGPVAGTSDHVPGPPGRAEPATPDGGEAGAPAGAPATGRGADRAREGKGNRTGKGNDKGKRKKLEIGGRVFARTSLIKAQDVDEMTALTAVRSARGGIDYRVKNVRAQIAVELAGKARVKDAWAQLRLSRAPKVDVRAGNFRMPISAIKLDSLWTLPLADRGLIDTILTGRMQITGRAPGVMASVGGGAPLHLTARLGMFQARNDTGDALAASARDGFGQTAVARVTASPWHGLELGASGQVRHGALIEAPVVIRRAYAAELDAKLSVPVGPGQLRAWLEGMVGTSWLVAGTDPSHHLTRFLEARGLVAYRLFRGAKRTRYVEVYGQAGALDPDRIVDRDRALELTGGLSVGAHDRWRAQLELEAWRFGASAPLGLQSFAALPRNSTTILAQLGVHI